MAADNVNITARSDVGGLVGHNQGHCERLLFHRQSDRRRCMSAVWWECNEGAVSNSYSTSSVTGEDAMSAVWWDVMSSTVSNSYSTGNVTGDEDVGGLVGFNSVPL